MNYQKHYDRLMSRAKDRILEGYIERHHIVPRCLGGINDPKNIVRLTPEEHYVAHQLLAKIHSTSLALIKAANFMTICSRGHRHNNKSFGWIKRKHSILMTGTNNPFFGKIHSAETKKKLSSKMIGSNNPMSKKGGHSEESRQKMKKPKTTEAKIKMSIKRKELFKENKLNFSGSKNGMFGKRGINCPTFGKPSKLKGKSISKEHKINISKGKQKLTEEQKRYLTEQFKKYKNYKECFNNLPLDFPRISYSTLNRIIKLSQL